MRMIKRTIALSFVAMMMLTSLVGCKDTKNIDEKTTVEIETSVMTELSKEELQAKLTNNIEFIPPNRCFVGNMLSR